MLEIKAHFDGKTLVPDEPVTLPENTPLRITIEVEQPKTKQITGPKVKRRAIWELGKNPVSLGITDASVNHDKYIYTGM